MDQSGGDHLPKLGAGEDCLYDYLCQAPFNFEGAGIIAALCPCGTSGRSRADSYWPLPFAGRRWRGHDLFLHVPGYDLCSRCSAPVFRRIVRCADCCGAAGVAICFERVSEKALYRRL